MTSLRLIFELTATDAVSNFNGSYPRAVNVQVTVDTAFYIVDVESLMIWKIYQNIQVLMCVPFMSTCRESDQLSDNSNNRMPLLEIERMFDNV